MVCDLDSQFTAKTNLKAGVRILYRLHQNLDGFRGLIWANSNFQRSIKRSEGCTLGLKNRVFQ